MFALRLPLIASFVVLVGAPSAESRPVEPGGPIPPLAQDDALSNLPPDAEQAPMRLTDTRLRSVAAELGPLVLSNASSLKPSSTCISTKSVICITD